MIFRMMMTRNDLAVCQVVCSPSSSSRGKYDLAGGLFLYLFFHGIMFCYVQSCLLFALRLLESSIRCSTYHGQKVISVIFDNHRAPRLAPVVLELRYRLALDSPGEMHYNICSLNDPFRYQSSFNHSPVVLELRYRLALNSLGSLQ